MVNRIVEVQIDLDDFNEDDLVEYLEKRDYLVEKKHVLKLIVIAVLLLILAIMVKLKVS